MALRDLSVLRNALLAKYNLQDFDKDTVLPSGFSQIIPSIGSSKVNYNKYTFSIVSASGLYIYFPNQLWFVANNFVELYNELIAYHEKLLHIFGSNKNTSEWQNVKNARNADPSAPAYIFAENALRKLSDPTDEALLLKFINDYNWWGGGKGLERTQNDYYVSPIMSAAGLVNDSQGLLSSMCVVLAQNPKASQLLKNFIIGSSNNPKKGFPPFPLQQITYGAPGTGKSHGIQEAEKDFAKVIRTTFHPDSDYSTFVGAYKPVKREQKTYSVNELAALWGSTYPTFPNRPEIRFASIYYKSLIAAGSAQYPNIFVGANTNVVNAEVPKGIAAAESYEKMIGGGEITYDFTPQAFTQAYIEAWKRYEKGEAVLLVIEEINRGNCAQIFGDLFQLLDRRDDGFSSYPIVPDTDLQRFVAGQGISVSGVQDARGNDISTEICNGTKLLLPPNLYIWATMNTSDQSLFPIDSAFKRRWDWKYVPIDTEKENWAIAVGGKKYSWTSFLNIINEEIFEKTTSEDKQLGFFFCKAKDGVISAERFVSKVLFFIYNDVYKDYNFDDDFFNDEKGKLTFRKYYTSTGSINEDKVERFLQNLKVEDYVEETGDEEDEAEPNGTSHMHLQSVTFEDGTKFSSDDLTRPEIYIKSLAKIGLERVEPVLNANPLPFHRCKCPIVSKTQYDAVLNSTNKYFEQDGYFIVSTIMDDTKIKVLQLLDKKYSLNLQIEWY